MKAKGAVSKKCYCRDGSGRRAGAGCLKLKRANGFWSPTHGVWTYQLELPRTGDGQRRYLRRVPACDATSHEVAVSELNHARELMNLAGSDMVLADEIATILMGCKFGRPLPDKQRLSRQLRSGVPNGAALSLGEYLNWWITARQIDDSTKISYASHVRVHLGPQLGHLPLQTLHTTHIEAMIGRMKQRNAEILAARASDNPKVRDSVYRVRLTMPATMTRIRATLCKALNDAVQKHRLIEFNPAIYAEMPTYDRPEVKVWTPQAIAQWKASGFIPSPVMVWTPEQAGVFLDHTQEHDPDLYPLFLLVMVGGPRRGEAVGLRADQFDLGRDRVEFTHQIATHGYRPVYKKVKTRNGDRTIHIDHATATDLQHYCKLRQAWQQAAGEKWPHTVQLQTPVPGGYTTIGVDLLFRQPDGQPWHPNVITARFKQAAQAAGLPPIRLHAAATYTKAAGGDLLDLKKKLGHASITVTADHYPAQLDDMDKALAERTAALIPRNRRHQAITAGPCIPATAAETGGKSRHPAGPPNRADHPKTAGTPRPKKNSKRVTRPRNIHLETVNDQVSTQAPGIAPVVFLAHTSTTAGGPPPGRRRDRYPSDLI